MPVISAVTSFDDDAYPSSLIGPWHFLFPATSLPSTCLNKHGFMHYAHPSLHCKLISEFTARMLQDALTEADLTSPDLKVVDVGGGTGFCTLGIVRHVNPANVTLIDQ